jgi:hypothetical protein
MISAPSRHKNKKSQEQELSTCTVGQQINTKLMFKKPSYSKRKTSSF